MALSARGAGARRPAAGRAAANIRFRPVARSMSDAAPLLSSGDDAPEDKYNLTYICFLVLGFGTVSTHAIDDGTFCILCARARARVNLNTFHSLQLFSSSAIFIYDSQGAFC
jgi:hypothetical protein